ncbi:MAG: HAD family acid phosphatase [Desulfovibrionaceae bacterium]|nr:HAD family acid phosphatase [Desulfovibrionaceae bacterium]
MNICLRRALALVLVLCLAGCNAAFSAGVRSEAGRRDIIGLPQAKDAVTVYYRSGMFDNEAAAVAREAGQYVERRLAQGVEKAAVVFDVDDTLLSNFETFQAADYGWNECFLTAWRDAALTSSFTGIRPMVELFCRLYDRAAIFIVTGRTEDLRLATMDNLARVGCPGWAGFFMRSDADREASAGEFKTGARRAISEMGYVILANIGDQEDDLSGGYCERAFKVPNYMYVLP